MKNKKILGLLSFMTLFAVLPHQEANAKCKAFLEETPAHNPCPGECLSFDCENLGFEDCRNKVVESFTSDAGKKAQGCSQACPPFSWDIKCDGDTMTHSRKGSVRYK